MPVYDLINILQLESHNVAMSMLLPLKLSLVRALERLLISDEGQGIRTFAQALIDSVNRRFRGLDNLPEVPDGIDEREMADFHVKHANVK